MDTSPARQFTYFSDTLPTAHLACSYRKNSHLTILRAAVSIVITLLLLYKEYSTHEHRLQIVSDIVFLSIFSIKFHSIALSCIDIVGVADVHTFVALVN